MKQGPNDTDFRVALLTACRLGALLMSEVLTSRGIRTAIAESPAQLGGLVHVGAGRLVIIAAPERDGTGSLEALMAGLRKVTAAPVLLLGKLRSKAYVDHVLRLGFAGILCRSNTKPDAILSSVRVAASGDVILPSGYFALPEDTLPAPLSTLSESDRDVLALVIKGKLNKEIAAELGRSELAIKMQLRGVYEKLGVRNRTQAAMLAVRHLT